MQRKGMGSPKLKRFDAAGLGSQGFTWFKRSISVMGCVGET